MMSTHNLPKYEVGITVTNKRFRHLLEVDFYVFSYE